MVGQVKAAEIEKYLFIFGETGSSYDTEVKRTDFRIGQLDIFGHILAGKGEGFTELVVEPEESGETVIDVERLYIGYLFHDSFNLRLGRFHTPFGYFTRVWHHGLYLMTPISRPKIIEFEDMGGALPIHLIGLEAEGKINLGIPFGYVFNFGNGNLQFGSSNITDFDKYKTFVGKIYVNPINFGEVGVSFSYDPFVFAEGATKVENMIFGGHIAYNNPGGILVDIESFFFRERVSAKNGFGGFFLLAYSFAGSTLGIEKFLHELRPYILVDTLTWQDGNTWFEKLHEKSMLEKRTRYAVGIRFGITPEAAIKIESALEAPKEGKSKWWIGTSFGFGLPVF